MLNWKKKTGAKIIVLRGRKLLGIFCMKGTAILEALWTKELILFHSKISNKNQKILYSICLLYIDSDCIVNKLAFTSYQCLKS